MPLAPDMSGSPAFTLQIPRQGGEGTSMGWDLKRNVRKLEDYQRLSNLDGKVLQNQGTCTSTSDLASCLFPPPSSTPLHISPSSQQDIRHADQSCRCEVVLTIGGEERGETR